jgi:hypothetical protein
VALPEFVRFKKETCLPIIAIFLVSLGGLILHLAWHPVTGEAGEASHLVPAAFGALSVLVVPFLLNHPKTVKVGYVLVVLSVAAGTVGMSYHSITHWPDAMPVTPGNIIFRTTLADIVIVWAKLPLAHAVLLQHRTAGTPAAPRVP